MSITKNTLLSSYNAEEHSVRKDFSLMDYRNNLFISSSASAVLSFYDSFSDRAELINWMQERPKGNTTIFEIEGDKDIIVVIPTKDIEGDLAQKCKDDIFKGLHIVFVESAFPKDTYFNYAHSCNIGIEKALKYHPSWIVLSNDDMIKVDDVYVLREKLLALEKRYKVIFTKDNANFSHNFTIRKLNMIGRLFLIFAFNLSRLIKLESLLRFSLYQKFLIYRSPFYSKPKRFTKGSILYKEIESYKVPGPFIIFSYEFIQSMNGRIFDEAFINGFEDTWLALNLKRDGTGVGEIDYKIKPMGGMSLGKGYLRYLREIPSLTLYNYYEDQLSKNIDHLDSSIIAR